MNSAIFLLGLILSVDVSTLLPFQPLLEGSDFYSCPEVALLSLNVCRADGTVGDTAKTASEWE